MQLCSWPCIAEFLSSTTLFSTSWITQAFLCRFNSRWSPNFDLLYPHCILMHVCSESIWNNWLHLRQCFLLCTIFRWFVESTLFWHNSQHFMILVLQLCAPCFLRLYTFENTFKQFVQVNGLLVSFSFTSRWHWCVVLASHLVHLLYSWCF